MHVTVCGGGNAAHVLAGLLSTRPGFSVHLYAPYGNEAELWADGIRRTGGVSVKTPEGQILGKPVAVTRDPAAAVTQSGLILLALPAFAHEAILRQIAPHISRGAWIGALPARGGFDLCVRDVLGLASDDHVIFGLQTLPWACRIEQYGQSATILGRKQQVDLAAWPSELAPAICAEMKAVLGASLNPMSGFLCATLADTGQMIHPGIMYGLFHDWTGEAYEAPRLFYQGVNAATAKVLQHMSDEIHNLRAALESRYPGLDLSAVRPLDEWLERSYSSTITDSRSLESSFVSNQSYAGLLAPMQKASAGYIPDFKARYLTEDVPFGLLVSRGIAELTGIHTAMIDQVLYWAQDRLQEEYLLAGKVQGNAVSRSRAPQRYGYHNLDEFMQEMQYPVCRRHRTSATEGRLQS